MRPSHVSLLHQEEAVEASTVVVVDLEATLAAHHTWVAWVAWVAHQVVVVVVRSTSTTFVPPPILLLITTQGRRLLTFYSFHTLLDGRI